MLDVLLGEDQGIPAAVRLDESDDGVPEIQGDGDGGEAVLLFAHLPVQVGHPAIGAVVPDVDGLPRLDHEGLDALMALQAEGPLEGDLHLLRGETDLVLALQKPLVFADQVDRDTVVVEDARRFLDDGGQDAVQGDGLGEQAADLVDRRQEPVSGVKITLVLLGLPEGQRVIFFLIRGLASHDPPGAAGFLSPS